MIKRIIACLTICLIITGLIEPVFSDASALPQPNWSDPGISEIINISDLTGWMLNGGTFDVSTYTDAESFMNDYFNARTQTKLVSPGDVQEDYYEVLPGFGISNQLVAGNSFARPFETNRVIASSFRDHTGYGQRLSNEVNEALLSSGHLIDTKIPLLSQVEFANFVGYTHDALNLYISAFDTEDSDPSPDPEFNFISNINSLYLNSGSYHNDFYSYTQAKNKTWGYMGSFAPKNYSWFFNGDISAAHINGVTGFTGTCLTPIITINLNESNGNYVATYSAYSKKVLYGEGYGTYIYDIVNNNVLRWDNASNTSVNPQTTFAGKSTAINYIYSHFSNVNIYVDGVAWVLTDYTPTPSITPEFPDAVGGEDLPTTTWPIFKPRAPYYTNVPGVLQAIEDAIADDGVLDIDDLKPYLNDENGDPVPDPIFDPEPVPLPVPDPINPDVVPGLPEIPVIPLNMPGYNGVSVLAEIINFTNQSLPTSLIVTFWGIVFGIVILGLIKILHK